MARMMRHFDSCGEGCCYTDAYRSKEKVYYQKEIEAYSNSNDFVDDVSQKNNTTEELDIELIEERMLKGKYY